MCSLVMSPCSRDIITIHRMAVNLQVLTCSKAPGFWMVEHQLVTYCDIKFLTPPHPIWQSIQLYHYTEYGKQSRGKIFSSFCEFYSTVNALQ